MAYTTATTAPDWKRIALWAVLVVSAVCNIVVSAMAINMFIASGFGLLTFSCGVVLVRGHYRNRRRRG
jgi:Flp pilus assembly protein TadB